MPILDYSSVDNLRSTMISNRSRYLQVWKDQAAFISPNRFNDNGDKHNGSRKDQKIINNIARRSLRTFVSGMMNGATSKARPWFKLTVTNPDKGKSTLSKKWFTDLENVLNNYFHVSNMYQVLPMAYKDIGTFSNAAFAMLPHPRYGFYFYPFAMGSYAFASDHEGNVNTFMRDFTYSVDQIVKSYLKLSSTGHINWEGVDPWIKWAWENSRYLDTATLTQVIVPNTKPNPRSIQSYDKKFQSYTYIKTAGTNLPAQTQPNFRNGVIPGTTQNFLSVKGFDYFPVICPRWEVAPEEDYGSDGPADIALGDVKSLQEKEKYKMEALAKLVKPPMVGPASLKRHQSSILAGGITYVDETSEASKFRPAFEVDPKLSELVQDIDKYENAIRSAFYEDLFLMLASERAISHVTAKEIEERQAEKLSALGPVLGQLDRDMSSKIIDNAYYILDSQKKLPKAPKELDGEELRPEYISILAQASKASMMTSAEKFVSFVSVTAQTVQDPALLKMIKADQLVREYGDYVGINPNLVLDEFEYDEVKQVATQERARLEQQQQLAQAASTAKDMSAAEMGDTNLLEQFAGAASPEQG